MFVENSKYDILTPDGWKNFAGIKLKGQKATFRIACANGTFVDATEDHYFFNESGKIQVKELEIGNNIQTVDGFSKIVAKLELKEEDIYDLVEVDQKEHKFIVNNSIISKNCDEFAMVDPPSKQRDFWASIRPTLSTGGDCIITSTPLSDEDTFAQIWDSASNTFDNFGDENPRGIGRNGFKAVKFTWEDHPERDELWADQERAAIGTDRFLREHECSFISDSDTLIDPIKLGNLKGVDPKFKTGQTKWYEEPKPNRTYLVSLDPCLGTGGDFAAIQVFQLPDMSQVAEWQHNRTDIRGQVKTLMDILKYIDSSVRADYGQSGDPEIYWTIENNNIGEAANIVIKETGEDKFPGTYLSEPKKNKAYNTKIRKGYLTTNKTKLAACARFKSLVERDKMVLKSKPLISELKVFVSKGASYGAKSREHDDLVSACLLIVRMVERVIMFNEEHEAELSESIDSDDTSGPLPIMVLNTR